jgi:hypothetical protein
MIDRWTELKQITTLPAKDLSFLALARLPSGHEA